ncbi:MAG: TRAP transporter substrate-binding protein [Gammaproteobacteria bacterium]|nr:TRAP transporter substrate-binding protein [Gammaproteobacteria bacterium]
MLPPPAMPHAKILVPWAEKVMKESNGRIKVDVYPSMQLGGKPPELINQARSGLADVIWTVGGYSPNLFTKASAFELPFMVTNAEATSKALWEYAQTNMQDEMADYKVLALHVHDRGVVHAVDKQVKSASDIKGAKFRAPNKVMSKAFGLLGANPVFMPVPAVASGLSKGVINMVALPYEVLPSFKLQELVKYHTEIPGDRGLYANFFIFAMNKDVYNKMPADLQKVIDNNSGLELSGHIGSLFDAQEDKHKGVTAKAGGKFTELSASEVANWKKAMQPITDEWIARMNKEGKNGKKLYAEANRLLDKHSK